MSETSILPGATPAPVADTSVPVPPEFDGEPTDDRRRLMIIGGIVAAVVVVIAAYLLLHKSSSSDSAFTPVPHGTPPASAPATGHGGSTKTGGSAKGHGTTTLPKRAKRLNVRDPFKPLVVPPVSGTTQQGSTTTVGAPATGPTSAPTTGTAPVVIPTTQPTSAGSNPPVTTPSGQPVWIRLVSTTSRTATFDVGYPHHKFHRFRVVAPSPSATKGTVFDKVFALLGIQGGTVTLQIGDATPFDLTKGVAHAV
jgi:hypothetical protein